MAKLGDPSASTQEPESAPKQIFIYDDEPLPIHIHRSIANVKTRNTLSKHIKDYGGEIQVDIDAASVVLADPDTDVFQSLVKRFQNDTIKHVESIHWVKKSIKKGVAELTPLVYKDPGGRRTGDDRQSFSKDDEENLCQWLALKLPYKEMKGRTGNKVYQMLCDLSEDPKYTWANRHPWQSWRERYKKNADRLDKRVAEIVEEAKPQIGEKGQYGFVRSKEGADEIAKSSPKKRARSSQFSHLENLAPGEVMMPLESSQHEVEEQLLNDSPPPATAAVCFTRFRSPKIAGPSRLQGSRSLQEREMVYQEDDNEWRIRIGNDAPPTWSNSETPATMGSPAKRKRLNEVGADQVGRRRMDTVEDVARCYRFTIEEVREFYDRCQSIERTSSRFKRMRDVLTETFADESA